MENENKNFRKLNTEIDSEDLLGLNEMEDNSLVLVDNDPNLNYETEQKRTSYQFVEENYSINESDILLKKEKNEIKKENKSENSTNDSTQTSIDWRREAMIDNFMPATVKLHRKELDVNEIIDPVTENRLIHLAVNSSFLNVTRCFVEIFECDINIQNTFGQTPLHLICNNPTKDAFLFSYLLKNENIKIDAVDKSGFTPLFYSVLNNFNIATMALANLKCDLSHVDNLGNNVLYHSIVSGNKFALNFLMRHMDGADINKRFYKDDANLADVLITSRNSSISKHLVKNFHNEIELKSIDSCKKSLTQFPVYNKFNYDILNTIYYYKTNNFLGFINALIRKEDVSRYNDYDNVRSTQPHIYTFKGYNLKVYVYDLLLKNTSRYVKYFAVFVYIIAMFYSMFRLNNFILENLQEGLTDMISVFTLFNVLIYFSFLVAFYVLFKFLFYKYPHKYHDETQYNLTNPLYSTDHVAHQIYQAIERNPLDLFFEEEICEICLTKKAKATNHCHSCRKCVPNFYFHSKLFDICFSRKNVFSYLIFLWSLILIHSGLIYFTYLSVNYEIMKNFPDSEFITENSKGMKTIYSSDYFTTNVITFILNVSFFKFWLILGLFVIMVLYFQTSFSLWLCVGYDVTYYNMFRYHKKSLGEIRLRNQLYYNIPHVNLVSIQKFWKNIIRALTHY